MEEGNATPEVTSDVTLEITPENPPVETVEELKQRLENAKAENQRKALEIQKLRDEQEARNSRLNDTGLSNPQDMTTWKDHELKAILKDNAYAAMHEQAQNLLEDRGFQRRMNVQKEQELRLKAELERQKDYPETYDPSNPLAIRMSELMHLHQLSNTPAGKLVAAKLAKAEIVTKKAVETGRKIEQNRQADVNANFSGDSGRPTPKVNEDVKLEELKKRAMAGDPMAKQEWFAHKGLFDFKKPS